jgi:hypothetical protein
MDIEGSWDRQTEDGVYGWVWGGETGRRITRSKTAMGTKKGSSATLDLAHIPFPLLRASGIQQLL